MSRLFYRNLKRSYPTVERGQGIWVWDTDGKQYLDGCSGAVAVNLGHGLAQINDAIAEQLKRVAFAHTSQFVSEPALKLAQSLIDLAPESFQQNGRVYFVCGGSEAVETALKMARGYFVERGALSRHLVISRWNSYHGSTLGALSATGHPARRKPYIPMLKEQPHINAPYPYRCLCGAAQTCNALACALARADELESIILKLGAENVMAFMAEPIVGAALGAVVPPDGYWQRVREICTRYGVLLIADEVMTGLGRAGAPFALDLWGVDADIIVVGKGLSAGYMPLGAVLANSEVVGAFANGSGVFEHGFTYSGHPVACAAGLAAIEMLTEGGVLASIEKKAHYFFAALEQLRSFEFVGEVRGHGLFAGLEFVADQKTKQPFPPPAKLSQNLAECAMREGLLVYPGAGFVDGGAGDHVIIAPPFTITEAEMDELIERLKRALHTVSTQITSRI